MERRLRWVTGLILFAFATSHFLSHATGLFGLRTLDMVGRQGILAVWRTIPGHILVFASLIIHAALGLLALYRRRHVRIPAEEAWQLGCGLLIPLLLLPHAVNVRVGSIAYGLDESYYRILYQYWLTSPGLGLIRQLTLLALVWIHGCIGLHFRLRLRPTYGRLRPWLAALACLVPFLALLGLVNAGWDTMVRSIIEPGFAATHGPPEVGSFRADAMAQISTIYIYAQVGWVAIIAAVLLARVLRNMRLRRSSVTLVYPGDRSVSVPVGFSVLEASRWAGIPHASICGGRGRCSTCRIRVGFGRAGLPEAEPGERATLDRIGAPSNVRLACQLRPRGRLSVAPLLPRDIKSAALRSTPDMAREVQITALYIDLRGSTQLADGRLPFDTLYIIDSYVQCVTAAVQTHGGIVASVAGDGMMCVFGLARDRRAKMETREADQAIAAALEIWQSLDRLSMDLAHELREPLAFGMGLHSGPIAASCTVEGSTPARLFLGDTGNVAARLEGLTKELRCSMILSCAVLEASSLTPALLRVVEITLRGRSIPVACITIATLEESAKLYAFPGDTERNIMESFPIDRQNSSIEATSKLQLRKSHPSIPEF